MIVIPAIVEQSRQVSADGVGSLMIVSGGCQMCFCLLFLDDFLSVLGRDRSPGQEAPLTPLCAGGNVANVPVYDLQEGGRSALLHFDSRTWTSEHWLFSLVPPCYMSVNL